MSCMPEQAVLDRARQEGTLPNRDTRAVLAAAAHGFRGTGPSNQRGVPFDTSTPRACSVSASMRAHQTLSGLRDSGPAAAARPSSSPSSPQRQQHAVAVLAPQSSGAGSTRATKPPRGGFGLLANLQSAWSHRAPQPSAQRVEELVQQVCAPSVCPPQPLGTRPATLGRGGRPMESGGTLLEGRPGPWRRPLRLPCARAFGRPARLSRPLPGACSARHAAALPPIAWRRLLAGPAARLQPGGADARGGAPPCLRGLPAKFLPSALSGCALHSPPMQSIPAGRCPGCAAGAGSGGAAGGPQQQHQQHQQPCRRSRLP